jgi:tetratricopeptide (TPR) repeat protein
MMRAFVLIVAVSMVLASARTGWGDTPPAVWDFAKDSAARERWLLHVRVERLLHAPMPDDITAVEQRRDDELRLETARAMLEQGDAEHSPDLRLRFDLGVVYEQLATVQMRNDLHQRVIDVLAPALDLAPDHPAATEALESLVYAYAKLNRAREELSTWRRYLGRLADQNVHLASSMMNMGEAQMRLGQLDEAIATFRNVLQICMTLANSSARNATYALTLWDLAVAYDRSGDARAALDSAAEAKELRWKEQGPLGQARDTTGWDAIRDDRSVFFVPDWEREWYLALGFAAAARDEHDARTASKLWVAAEEHWGTYVTRAAGSGGDDRWLVIARVRRDRAHAERAHAEKRAAALLSRKKKDEGSGVEREL